MKAFAALSFGLLLVIGGVGGEQGSGDRAVLLCPSGAGVCSWGDSGWQVLWRAEPGTARYRLSSVAIGSFRLVQEAAPGGGKVMVFGPSGALLSVQQQGFPLSLPASVGGGPRAVALCSGSLLETTRCSSWILSEGEPVVDSLPVLPDRCLFPRTLGHVTFCLEDSNPLRDPVDDQKLTVWSGSSDRDLGSRRPLSLPPGSVSDFLPLENERSLFVLDTGELLEVHDWARVKKLQLGGVLRLQRVAARILALLGPLAGNEGVVVEVLPIGGRELWRGPGVPIEIAEWRQDRLLLHTEDPRNNRSSLVEIGFRDGGKPTSRVLGEIK